MGVARALELGRLRRRALLAPAHQGTSIVPLRPSRLASAARLAPVLALLCSAAPAAAAVPYSPDALARLKGRPGGDAILSQLAQPPAGVDELPSTLRFTLDRYPAESVERRQAVVILADFPDSVGSTPEAHFDSLVYGMETPFSSMRQFYLENSYGRFDLVGATVTHWIRMSHPMSYYSNNAGGFGAYPQNAQGLAEEAMQKADASVDFSQFDNDGPDGIPRGQGSTDDDGFVDFVVIVHAGPGRETTLRDVDIHSHTWIVPNAVAVDGVMAQAYSMLPETGEIGVYCHEFGHLLGLPDLYSAGGAAILGVYSLMATGVWNGRAVAGDRPAHLDAWSKVQLGFVTPAVPATNASDATLAAVETTPAVWKLWTNGRPDIEYFLVENREHVGFDDTTPGLRTGLPSDGLVIYHVDERIADNLTAPLGSAYHPRIGVVEANGDVYGRDDLQRVCGTTACWGDAGDVFPGSDGHTDWTQLTTASTRAFDGSDTQVALTNIRLGGGTVTANVQVASRPAIVVTSVDAREVPGTGDGDGLAYAGEDAELTPHVRNVGIAATNVSAIVISPDPLAPIASGGSLSFGDMPANSSATGGTVIVRLAGVLPSDPYGFPLALDVQGDGFAATDTVQVAVGATYSFGDDAESGTLRLVSSALAPASAAAWHRSPEFNTTPNGTWCWKAGSTLPAGSYAAGLDAVLVTPSLLLDGTGVLRIQSKIDAEATAGSGAYDGGMVEMSIAGGSWQPLIPDGGYPYALRSRPSLPQGTAGRGVISGTSSGFASYVFPLTGAVGEARLRFRFVSDSSNPRTYTGWFLDDMQVDTEREPYTVTLMDPVRDVTGMHLTWRVTPGRRPYDRTGFALYRGTGSSGAETETVQRDLAGLTPLTLSLVLSVDGRATGDDPAPPTGVPFYYVLVDSLTGARSRLAAFGGPQEPVSLRVFPNPVRASVTPPTILYQVTEAGPVSVRVTDAAGRTVATLVDGLKFAGPQAVTWNGLTSPRGAHAARPAPAGVYFAVVESGGMHGAVRFLLLR